MLQVKYHLGPIFKIFKLLHFWILTSDHISDLDILLRNNL